MTSRRLSEESASSELLSWKSSLSGDRRFLPLEERRGGEDGEAEVFFPPPTPPLPPPQSPSPPPFFFFISFFGTSSHATCAPRYPFQTLKTTPVDASASSTRPSESATATRHPRGDSSVAPPPPPQPPPPRAPAGPALALRRGASVSPERHSGAVSPGGGGSSFSVRRADAFEAAAAAEGSGGEEKSETIGGG